MAVGLTEICASRRSELGNCGGATMGWLQHIMSFSKGWDMGVLKALEGDPATPAEGPHICERFICADSITSPSLRPGAWDLAREPDKPQPIVQSMASRQRVWRTATTGPVPCKVYAHCTSGCMILASGDTELASRGVSDSHLEGNPGSVQRGRKRRFEANNSVD